MTRPILGLPSRIHATTNSTPGMTSGTIDNPKNKRRNGVLVRSFIHAREVPTTNETSDVPTANRSELPSNRPVSADEYAAR